MSESYLRVVKDVKELFGFGMPGLSAPDPVRAFARSRSPGIVLGVFLRGKLEELGD